MVRESRDKATLMRWAALQVPFGRLGSSGITWAEEVSRKLLRAELEDLTTS